MRRILARLVLAAPLALSGACGREADEGGEPSGRSDEAEGTVGLFTLLHDAATDDPGAVTVAGQFLHYRNVSRPLAVRALDPKAAALELSGPLDRCRAGGEGPGERAEVEADGLDYRIELLDAGVLVSGTSAASVALPPRRFPEILPALSGVVYGTADGEALPFLPEADYVLSGGGGEDVGPFRVEVVAPPAPEVRDLALLPLSDGGVEVQWGEGDPEADLVHVELARDGGTLSCAVADRGSFRIGAAALASLPGQGRIRLTVSRVRVQPFSAPGIPRADVLFVAQARAEVQTDGP